MHQNDPQIITTAWVLTEVADALAKSRRNQFAQLVAAIAADVKTELVPSTPALFDAGVALYVSRADKTWPLTDCISFVVMREWDLTDALTADRHFVQAGFRTLL
jgi:hypothetical protein